MRTRGFAVFIYLLLISANFLMSLFAFFFPDSIIRASKYYLIRNYFSSLIVLQFAEFHRSPLRFLHVASSIPGKKRMKNCSPPNRSLFLPLTRLFPSSSVLTSLWIPTCLCTSLFCRRRSLFPPRFLASLLKRPRLLRLTDLESPSSSFPRDRMRPRMIRRMRRLAEGARLRRVRWSRL